jgi:hypothetical protein
VASGEVVVLNGAAGGVGLFASQLAVRRGARVLGSAMPDAHAVLREMGVEPFDFREDVATWVRSQAPDGVDAVLDAVGAPPVLDLSLAVVRDRRSGRDPDPEPGRRRPGDQAARLRRGRRPGHRPPRRRPPRAGARRRGGWLRVVVAETFPLAEPPPLTARWSASTEPGKLVLVP